MHVDDSMELMIQLILSKKLARIWLTSLHIYGLSRQVGI
jgi:hypothetical protein